MFVCVAALQAWLPWFKLGLPTQQPAQLSEAPPLPGLPCGQVWLMLRSEQGRTALPCGGLCLSRLRFRDGVSHWQWPLGSQVCFWEGVICLLTHSVLFWQWHSVASVSAAVYCGTLTPWKIKEGMFLTSVNRWEVACSVRCRTGLAASLRWALSLELCLFVMSVRKNFAEEPYRHPLIRFLQGDLFFLPLVA